MMSLLQYRRDFLEIDVDISVTHDSTNFITSEAAYIGFSVRMDEDFFMVAFGPAGISVNDADDTVRLDWDDVFQGARIKGVFNTWLEGQETLAVIKRNAEEHDIEMARLQQEFAEEFAEAEKHETLLVGLLQCIIKMHAHTLRQDMLSVKQA